MKSRHSYIFLAVNVAIFLLFNLGISLTSGFTQIQEEENTEPVYIGLLGLTNLVAEGNLSSVGHTGEEYTGEVDQYFFTSAVNTTATITLSFDPSNDYDIYLYDANGLVMGSATYDNPEILSYGVTDSATYFIYVVGWEGSPGDYAISISPGDVEPPEPIEPVELDFTDLMVEGTLSSVGNDGQDYIGEFDWYIFITPITATVTITLSFDTGNDFDLYLYDANASEILDSSKNNNPEKLVYDVSALTAYLIAVAGWDGSPGDYILTINPEDVEIPVEMNLPAGWSMISLPVRPDNFKLSEIFPDTEIVYGYKRGIGYVQVGKEENLKLGKGYWIFLNDERKYPLTGRPIDKYTRSVYENGWDMISGCTYSARISINNGKIDVIYKYVQGWGYKRVLESENLSPGNGYWILFSNTGDPCELKIERTEP